MLRGYATRLVHGIISQAGHLLTLTFSSFLQQLPSITLVTVDVQAEVLPSCAWGFSPRG